MRLTGDGRDDGPGGSGSSVASRVRRRVEARGGEVVGAGGDVDFFPSLREGVAGATLSPVIRSSSDLIVRLRMTKIGYMRGCIRARGIECEVRKLLKGSILTGIEEVAGGNGGGVASNWSSLGANLFRV